MVGEDVPAATSRSMTFSRSLGLGFSGGLWDGGFSRVQKGACVPVSESLYAISQVAAGLILWIHKHLDVDFWQLLRDELSQVLGECIVVSKGRVTPLCTG